MTYTPPLDPRYVYVARGGGIFGDTASGIIGLAQRFNLASVFETGCDMPSYKYRRVARDDPDARTSPLGEVLDVYRVPSDYVLRGAAAVERDCRYIVTLTRVIPACCFCGSRLVYGVMGWVHGYYAAPLNDGQCCAACFDTKVRPLWDRPPPSDATV